jgi:hypothetical protein
VASASLKDAVAAANSNKVVATRRSETKQFEENNKTAAVTVSSWSLDDVTDWLNGYAGSLSRYTESFRGIGVDGEMLKNMNDTDLCDDLKVCVRLHRVKILNEIKRLVMQENLLRGGSGSSAGSAGSVGSASSAGSAGLLDELSVQTWSSPSQSHRSSSSRSMPSVHNNNNDPIRLSREQSTHSFVSTTSSGGTMSDTDHERDRSSTAIDGNSCRTDHDIYALFSNPLVDNAKQPICKLEHEKEMQIMCASLRKGGRDISLTMSHATTDALCTAVTLGCKVLHYSGHADASSLSFEDSNGRLHRLDVERLGDLFGRRVGSSIAANKNTSVSTTTTGCPPLPDLVFVSACHSEAAGNAFLRAAGNNLVVVAVEMDSKLEDLAAHAFTRAFYFSLATGNSVESSFHIGQSAVQAAPGRSKEAATSEAKKFKLMDPSCRGGIKPFATSLCTGFVEPPSLIKDVIPVVPQGFVGRGVEMYSIIRQLKLHRTVSVVGEQGMGKSAVAIAVANYVSERQMYRDGIYYVRCAHDDDAESLSARMLQQWYDRDLRSSMGEKTHRGGNRVLNGSSKSQHNYDRSSLERSERVGGGSSSSRRRSHHGRLNEARVRGISEYTGSSCGSGGGGRDSTILMMEGDEYSDMHSEDGFPVAKEIEDSSNNHSSNNHNHNYHNHNNHNRVKGPSAESELLMRLRNDDCLCVLDQASGAVGMFVQTIVERTSGVRFLLTTTQRSLADEHSIALLSLCPEAAVRMFIRRCPRENLSVREIPAPKQADVMINPKNLLGRLRHALVEADVLTPGSIMRVCARMREPHGLTLCESLSKEEGRK